jgi:hypothetical protein
LDSPPEKREGAGFWENSKSTKPAGEGGCDGSPNKLVKIKSATVTNVQDAPLEKRGRGAPHANFK